MTPLAMQIAKDLTIPRKDRSKHDHGSLLNKLSGIHCFEISEIREDAYKLGREAFVQGVLTEEQCFLPAPKTWIEFKSFSPEYMKVGLKYMRVGFLLENISGRTVCWTAYSYKDTWTSWPDSFL